MNPTKTDLIAIDVSKDSLQVQSETISLCVVYNEEGLAGLFEMLATLEEPLVVCEATGGYERKLVALCHEKGIGVCVVNPGRVRAFARSEGMKVKTDPIDAKMLLRFAQEKNLCRTPPPSRQREALAALLDRRSHLSEALAREKNRLPKSPKLIRCSIERMIRVLEKEIARIDARIGKIIDSDNALREQSRIIQSIVGMGKITAWTLLAYLSEITDLKRNEVVALAGLAPFNRDSGKRKGKRSIQAGRAKVRRSLYMAAQSAAIHNAVIRPYVEGLRARGKPYKCAIVAAMRKLLIHTQSLLKNPQFCLAS